ncbi:MAG: cyclase family protein [Propionibacteriaceae bacterium]|jgi:kynurenine formamidase|nr:cyclase family protein [Propionibacteriaceae bacterium]
MSSIPQTPTPAPGRWVDLTRTLASKGHHSATQPTPLILPNTTHAESAASRGGGFSTASMLLLFSDHAGTHVDAWRHMDPDPAAGDVASMPLDLFCATATAVDLSGLEPDDVIPADDLERALDDLSQPVEAVLIRTDAVPEPCPDLASYMGGFPGLSGDAVHRLADRGVRLLGTDARSIDTAASERASGDAIQPAHRATLARGVVHIENLFIPASLCGQVFELFAFPLKLAGATGSPVRAVARLTQV